MDLVRITCRGRLSPCSSLSLSRSLALSFSESVCVCAPRLLPRACPAAGCACAIPLTYCDPDYECSFTTTDTDGLLYEFDLSSLCNSTGDYVATDGAVCIIWVLAGDAHWAR